MGEWSRADALVRIVQIIKAVGFNAISLGP